MTRISPRAAIATVALAGAAMIAQPAAAEGNRMYEVTITNLTAGQVVTPPLVVTHEDGFTLFESGAEASMELATLAETGDPGPLAGLLMTMDEVIGVATGMGPIMPGASATVEVPASRSGHYLSFAAMLALTNDAFAAVRGLELPGDIGKSVTTRAVAYDAGSEGNNELASHVPGPPFEGMDRDTSDMDAMGNMFVLGDEGFIHIHPGVHGRVDGMDSDLDPAVYDWRNPVVEVTAERIM